MSNVKNVIALTQETVANSTTGDVNTDDNTLFVDKSDNRVGIGTATPSVTLDVSGEVKATDFTIGASGKLTSNNYAQDTFIANGNIITTYTSNSHVLFNGNVTAGNVNATYFKGNGSQLTNLSAGASGGGSDQIFFLSDINVNNDYTIPTGKNALSAGPTVVNTGITVTVPSGSTWTIV